MNGDPGIRGGNEYCTSTRFSTNADSGSVSGTNVADAPVVGVALLHVADEVQTTQFALTGLPLGPVPDTRSDGVHT